MRKDLTEMVFILDRSGSMRGLEKDTIDNFNAMLRKQRDCEGDAIVSTILFNSFTGVLHDRLPLAEVEPMTEEDYRPCASTALLDALGDTLHRIGEIHEDSPEADVPEHTVVVIITDGQENDSRRYSMEDVRELIEKAECCGWEFIFLGANMDAVETAAKLNIRRDRAARYHCDKRGLDISYSVVGDIISDMRRSTAPSNDCMKRIVVDYEERE